MAKRDRPTEKSTAPADATGSLIEEFPTLRDCEREQAISHPIRDPAPNRIVHDVAIYRW